MHTHRSSVVAEALGDLYCWTVRAELMCRSIARARRGGVVYAARRVKGALFTPKFGDLRVAWRCGGRRRAGRAGLQGREGWPGAHPALSELHFVQEVLQRCGRRLGLAGGAGRAALRLATRGGTASRA